MSPQKGEATNIKLLSLTPFWHRRLCEAIAVFGLLIIGLFVWTNSIGINNPNSEFFVAPIAAVVSFGAVILAGLAYFVVPEKQRSVVTYAAYWVLLFAVAALNFSTGNIESPFIATWMIVAIFAGIFGYLTILLIGAGMAWLVVATLLAGDITNGLLIDLVLAGILPIIVSFILWHGKSGSEKSKDRAYYDLANELDQVSNKSDVVIGAISDGVMAVNNQGQIELINPAAQRIVGWGNKDALNLDYKSVLQLLHSDGSEVDKSGDPVFDVLTTNQPVRRNDLQLQTSSGKKIIIEVVVSPIGHLGSGAIIVFRDVTKEQEEERSQAEFISTASHEMRTPVASIEGYLGLALNPATATVDEKARDFITKAHEAATHLGRLFQDLLDISKADDGRLKSNPKVINVVDFTDEIVEGLRAKADEKGLRLFFKAKASDPGGLRNIEPVYFVDTDADHLREVVANLVENAIKYTKEGEVIVDVKGDNAHVIVSITDSGIGIPAEDIPHLFQKFYRVDNSDTREIGGTGLGLYLCRRLVESMGGRIWVNSEYKKGSTFSIELNRLPNEDATRLIEARANQATASSNVKLPEADEELHLDTPTEAQINEALSTPIVMKKDKAAERAENRKATSAAAAAAGAPPPKYTTTTPANAGAPETQPTSADPLVGSPITVDAPEPLRPHIPMVLPPAMQAVESNLQTATPVTIPVTSMPTPAPAVTPTVPTPTVTAPQPTVPQLTVPDRPTISTRVPAAASVVTAPTAPTPIAPIDPVLRPHPQAPPVQSAPNSIPVQVQNRGSQQKT